MMPAARNWSLWQSKSNPQNFGKTMTDSLSLLGDVGSTRLSPEEREGLIPSYITFHHELNEAEQGNILAATRWLKVRRSWLAEPEMVEESFVREVHRRMFNKVWRWAGD